MGRTISGALIGMVLTFVFYFIPVVNSVAPLLGGFLAGYYADGGFEGGLKSGVLMTVFMIIPVFLLGGGVLGTVLRNSPVLGGFIAASTLIVALVVIIHTAITGIIGSVAGALVAGR